MDLTNYYKNRLSKIRSLLKKDTDNLTEKDIHKLRIEIKKLDALIYLVENSGSSKIRGYLKPFSKLFKKAGKLRSVQVEHNLISSYLDTNSNTGYLRHLRKIKSRRHSQLEKLIDNGIESKLKKASNKITPCIKGVTPKKVLRYLRNEQRAISKMLEKKIFSEQKLHGVRKNLKRYYLNVNNVTDDGLDDHWKKLLELLGKWHDRQEAFDQLIKAIYSGHLNKNESAHLKKIKTKLVHDKSRLFEKIVGTYTYKNGQSLLNMEQIKELSST